VWYDIQLHVKFADLLKILNILRRNLKNWNKNHPDYLACFPTTKTLKNYHNRLIPPNKAHNPHSSQLNIHNLILPEFSHKNSALINSTPLKYLIL